MDKRYKDNHGKAIKWRDTMIGKNYQRRITLKLMGLAGLTAQTIAKIEAIQATKAETKLEKIEKAAAIAEIVVTCHINNLKALRR